MFHSHVSFICYPSIPVCSRRFNRAIHQHTFSHLADAKLTDCMTCLTSQTFLFYFPHTIAFLPVFQCFSLHMFELVFVFTCLFPCFHSFTFFRPSVPPHDSAVQFTNTDLVAWPAHNFLIALPASPHKAQQSYQPHLAIDPIFPSTLSPSKAPGTSFSSTSNITL